MNTMPNISVKERAAKLSISMPESMVQFIDERCRSFRVGRSAYLQMLLEAEQSSPRDTFTKAAAKDQLGSNSF